ncbi:MAG: DUF6807 family protein [Verrucomicrobiales bacterium]
MSAFLVVGFVPTTSADIRIEGRDFAPGQTKVEVNIQGKPGASFVYGEKEMKPYLNVHAPDGTLLTEWNAAQPFPHHRGIYIGWNKISSDLGSFDLWHFNNGGEMRVKTISTRSYSNSGNKDKAVIEAGIEWRAKPEGESESKILLTERRTMAITPMGEETQVDISFKLKAARDLTLGGDLQHSGVHFRASHTVAEREKETSYLWEPSVKGPGGKAKSDQFKWVRFFFPIGDKWYSATQHNHPQNPVEELSWRNYGRFGFFFPTQLKKDQELELKYRFIVSPVEKPEADKHSEEELKAYKAATDASYHQYIASPADEKMDKQP